MQLAETALRAAMALAWFPIASSFRACSTPTRQLCKEVMSDGLLGHVRLCGGQRRLRAQELGAVLAQRSGVAADLCLEDAEVTTELLQLRGDGARPLLRDDRAPCASGRTGRVRGPDRPTEIPARREEHARAEAEDPLGPA